MKPNMSPEENLLPRHSTPPLAGMFTVNMEQLIRSAMGSFLIVRVSFIYSCCTWATASDARQIPVQIKVLWVLLWPHAVRVGKQTKEGGDQKRCRELHKWVQCWPKRKEALFCICLRAPEAYSLSKGFCMLQQCVVSAICSGKHGDVLPIICDIHQAVFVNSPVCCHYIARARGSGWGGLVFLSCLLLCTYESPWQHSHRPASCFKQRRTNETISAAEDDMIGWPSFVQIR